MNQYRVGFKWKSGEEYYVTMKSTSNSTKLAEELLKLDRTGKLETVYVKLID